MQFKDCLQLALGEHHLFRDDSQPLAREEEVLTCIPTVSIQLCLTFVLQMIKITALDR